RRARRTVGVGDGVGGEHRVPHRGQPVEVVVVDDRGVLRRQLGGDLANGVVCQVVDGLGAPGVGAGGHGAPAGGVIGCGGGVAVVVHHRGHLAQRVVPVAGPYHRLATGRVELLDRGGELADVAVGALDLAVGVGGHHLELGHPGTVGPEPVGQRGE